jgi:hypothetical protein
MFLNFRRLNSWTLMISLKFYSTSYRDRQSSKLSRKKITLLQLSISFCKLEKVLLQFFKACLSCLNLAAKIEGRPCLWRGSCDQEVWTVSMKPWIGQKFSNLKMLDFGMLVPVVTLHGMWSEMGLDMGRTREFGYFFVQCTEVKNQSSCSSKGSCCILLHVKALPLRQVW